jgi:hypothetical protein
MRSDWELTKPIAARIAAYRLRQAERQITAAHITKVQEAHTGVKPVRVVEPS